MSGIRKIKKVLQSRPTMEGAGVHLNRVFGFSEEGLFDPFLLLDDFGSDNPDDYTAGFPWHPHRGIETITYVLEGDVEHSDSLGNKGIIGSGDVQWMTAGSGIIHQEMPRGSESGRMYGFQLWANLPAKDKMMTPRYRDISSEQIPVVKLPSGVTAKVIAGEVAGVKGPVADIVIDPEYLDITIPAHSDFRHKTKRGHTVFAYVFEGEGIFSHDENPCTYEEGENPPQSQDETAYLGNGSIVLYEDGDEVVVYTKDKMVRFLLISGKPLGEPIAWQGPIVMNTKEELQIAFSEYREGTFIK